LQINLTELLRAKAEKQAERLISNWSGRHESRLQLRYWKYLKNSNRQKNLSFYF